MPGACHHSAAGGTGVLASFERDLKAVSFPAANLWPDVADLRGPVHRRSAVDDADVYHHAEHCSRGSNGVHHSRVAGGTDRSVCDARLSAIRRDKNKNAGMLPQWDEAGPRFALSYEPIGGRNPSAWALASAWVSAWDYCHQANQNLELAARWSTTPLAGWLHQDCPTPCKHPIPDRR